jgi:hypothetical protein
MKRFLCVFALVALGGVVLAGCPTQESQLRHITSQGVKDCDNFGPANLSDKGALDTGSLCAQDFFGYWQHGRTDDAKEITAFWAAHIGPDLWNTDLNGGATARHFLDSYQNKGTWTAVPCDFVNGSPKEVECTWTSTDDPALSSVNVHVTRANALDYGWRVSSVGIQLAAPPSSTTTTTTQPPPSCPSDPASMSHPTSADGKPLTELTPYTDRSGKQWAYFQADLGGQSGQTQFIVSCDPSLQNSNQGWVQVSVLASDTSNGPVPRKEIGCPPGPGTVDDPATLAALGVTCP